MTDFVWVGSSGVYADANQWRNADTGMGPPAGPPGLNDTGTIDNGGTASINGALEALGGGLLGGAGGGTIDVNTGGTFEVGNSPTSALLIGGQVAGALNVAAGGQVQFRGTLAASDPAFVFGQAAGQAGLADVQGVVMGGGNPIVIGGAGRGSVTVHGGGTMGSGAPFGASFAALDLGQAAGGTGTLTVSDPGALVVAEGLVDVGDGGTGTLTVENGGTFDGGFQSVGMAIGLQAGATGLVTVESGATVGVNGPLEVGALGSGTLLVEGGGTVSISGTRFAEVAAVIAAQPGSSGTVRVDGAGSLLGFGSGVQIGTGGTIAVTSGGSVDIYSSLQLAGTATVAVDAGSVMVIGPSNVPNPPGSAGALTVLPFGTIAGGGTVAGNVVNNGTVQATGALAITGDVTGTGQIDIGAAPAVIEFEGAVGSGQTIVSSPGAHINIDAPLAFAATIAGLPVGLNIHLAGFVLTGGSLTGAIGGNGSLVADGAANGVQGAFAALVLGLGDQPIMPLSATNRTELTVGIPALPATNAAAVQSALAVLTPASGALNETFVIQGGTIAPPVAGALNEAALVEVDSVPPGTLALPAGYQAGFVQESNPGATLSDANGHALLVGNFPGGSIIASGPSDTMVGGGSTAFYEFGGGNDSIVGGGADTVVGSTGNDTIVTSASGTLIAPGKGNDLIEDHGSDVIFAGGGSDTVLAFGGVFAGVGSGTLIFINGSNASAIIGGNAGTDIVNAGAGGGIYGAGGGGGSVLVAGSGAATLFGVANGDALFAGGSAADVLVAGAGNETLSGLGSSGNNVFYGGSGNDLMGGGAGSETFFAGTGNDTMIAGSGADLFAFVNGRAGGTDLIEGFNTAAGDRVTLQNYGADAVQSALGSATVAGGSTTIALADHTAITFAGVTSLTSAAFL